MTSTPENTSLVARLVMTPAAGRATLAHDTSVYVGDLGRAAELLAAEVDAATAARRARESLAPFGIAEHGAIAAADDRAPASFPPLLVWAEILEADATRLATLTAAYTLTAAQYAAAAMHALGAMLRGREITPAHVELQAVSRAHRAETLGDTESPTYGLTVRPTLPDLSELATGHNALDLAVGTAYVALYEVYEVARHLERADRARRIAAMAKAAAEKGEAPAETAEAEALLPEPVEAPTGDVTQLAPLLVAFGHACLDAARYGHPDPHPAAHPAPAATFLPAPAPADEADDEGDGLEVVDLGEAVRA